MTGTEPKTTLREFREYFASSYEALGKLAARIGVTHPTLADVLANSRALARLWLKIKSRPQQEFVAWASTKKAAANILECCYWPHTATESSS